MHKSEIENLEPSIIKGINAVGVGQRGSRNLDEQTITELIEDLKNQKVPSLELGAFLGALFFKGLTPDESRLEQGLPSDVLKSPKKLAEFIAPDVSAQIKELCFRLLDREQLSFEEAFQAGQFLFDFSDESNSAEGARGLMASILRVRYETDDEYAGLMKAMNATVQTAFTTPAPEGKPIVQIAEPFDGVNRSYMITPLIASHMQSLGFRAVSLMGRSGGPKQELNVRDLARELNCPIIRGNQEIDSSGPEFGFYIDQPDLSPALDAWIDRRRRMRKRPFLATLEKFPDPASASLLITSAFHAPYSEKMLTLAERLGYPAAIVMRKGQEGTLSFSLSKPAEIHCTIRQKNNTYLREFFTFSPVEADDQDLERDGRMKDVNAVDNAVLIKNFINQGKSGDERFDRRIGVTLSGLDKAITWLKDQGLSL